MARILSVIALLLVSVQLKALEPIESAMAYEHLLEVNVQWAHFKEAAPLVEVRFRNEDERIKFHLQNVIHALREGDLSPTKAALLDRLWQYAEDQQFPVNTGHKGRRPYFIDYKDTHCAVGYLMKESGHGQLAQRIRQEHNYDYIQDITTEGIPEWAKEYDFTPEELAWIQPGYTVETVFSPVAGTLNASVTSITGAWNSNDFFVLGLFDAVAGIQSSGLARFDGSTLVPMVQGLTGDIENIMFLNDELMVCGNLSFNNHDFPIAFIDGEVIEALEVPERSGAKGLAYISASGFGNFYLALNPEQASQSEIWKFENASNTWEIVASVNGVIKGLTYSPDGRVAYGAFDMVNVYDGGAVDTAFSTNNMFRMSPAGVYSIHGETSDTVLCAYPFGNIVYFGGSSQSGPVLSRYYPYGSVQSVLQAQETYPVRKSIRTIGKYDDSNLIVGGGLNFGPEQGSVGIAYHGNNLGLYNPLGHIAVPLGNFSSPVNSVWKSNGTWYVGGEFSDSTINYIARMENPTGVNRTEKNAVKLYLNPVVDNLNVTIPATWTKKTAYRLFDVKGTLVMEESNTGTQNQLDLSGLSSGKYVLTVSSDGSMFSSFVVVKD